MARMLSADDLYRACDRKIFRFENTEELAPLDRIIGQERALDAIDFGLNLKSIGFNIYVLGDSGTGKTSAIRSFISKKAEGEPVPPDWCYVFNYKDAGEPIALSLAPGRGIAFQKDTAELISALKVEIPKIFESKEYEKQKSAIVEEFQRRQKELFDALQKEADAKGFNIGAKMGGFTLTPRSDAGEPLTEEEFNSFDEARKTRIRETGKQIQEKIDDAVRVMKGEDKAAKKRLGELERYAALSVLGHLIEEIQNKHGGNEKLVAWLDAVKEDILANIDDFKAAPEEAAAPPVPFLRVPKQEPDFTRYTVNVLVDNGEQKGSPCVFESNPTYYNLFGRVEHKFQFGMAMTDFSMIKAGSLHKANGGFLVLNALDLLRNLFSYDALKRAIRNGEVKIEDVWEQYRLLTTATMKPEAIPLDVKVILIGNPEIYYLLYNLDEEYRELFKVKADFDNRMQRTEENVLKYAAFIAAKARGERLLPFDPSGVGKVVEYGSRMAEHQEKLSSKFSEIANLIRESHYWARKDCAGVVSDVHVERALDEKVYRHSMIEDRLRELMAEGTLIVETSGEKAGQVNGLAVLELGDYSFGKPSRITTAVYAGKGGVVNIERETKLSGKIHEKAILILSNYLGRKYAERRPISLTASITFEQLYGMIEGDSATCAELYSLLSAISGIPIRQNIAVTGSMDQNGNVQPIGGVNEKIEGFFDLCRLRGFEGTPGVVIPLRNVRNLMLKKSVLDAVRDGKFRVYAIDHVEEGIEVLMGIPAGERGPDGAWPEGTLSRIVEDRLTALREAVKKEENEKNKGRKKENDV
ncbi:MAG: AAA family ATPase [Deltaproteobacteria bacterium]|nr:AAA family ATPase [Deltaproteobacteria bacterium]